MSTATVSKVVHGRGRVSEACRARVKAVIDELQYRPNTAAQALVRRSGTSIGVVTPKLAMTFFGCLAAGVEDAARAADYRLLMCNSQYETRTEWDAIQSLRQHNCDAIVLHSEYSSDDELAHWAEQIPGLVLINRRVPALADRCIWLDNVAGGRAITEHLLDLGHRHFACVSSVYQNRDPDLRIAGARQALAARGLALPDTAIVRAGANLRGGAEAVRELVGRGSAFTALLCYNDLMAVGAMNALQDLGVAVPRQLSVVGFDDLYVSSACRPALTTMVYPVEAMGRVAGELAIARATGLIADGDPLPPFAAELLQRQSAAPPPAAPIRWSGSH